MAYRELKLEEIFETQDAQRLSRLEELTEQLLYLEEQATESFDGRYERQGV